MNRARLARAFSCTRLLGRADVRCLLALGSVGHIECDALIFFQRLEPGVLNLREVRKQIFATAVRGDETKAFCVVEPLHSTCTHAYLPSNDRGLRPMCRSFK